MFSSIYIYVCVYVCVDEELANNHKKLFNESKYPISKIMKKDKQTLFSCMYHFLPSIPSKAPQASRFSRQLSTPYSHHMMNYFICGYLRMTGETICKGCEGFLPGLKIIGRVEVGKARSKPARTTLEKPAELWTDPSTADAESECLVVQI